MWSRLRVGKEASMAYDFTDRGRTRFETCASEPQGLEMARSLDYYVATLALGVPGRAAVREAGFGEPS